MPQVTDSIVISIPIGKLIMWYLGNPVGFSALAKVNDFLTQRVALPSGQQLGPDKVV